MRAIQGPLSTNRRSGTTRTGCVRWRPLCDERGIQVVVEAFTQVAWQAVDHAAQLEKRVLLSRRSEGADGSAYRLRLRPAPGLRPCFEPVELRVVEIHLNRAAHERDTCQIMKQVSTRS